MAKALQTPSYTACGLTAYVRAHARRVHFWSTSAVLRLPPPVAAFTRQVAAYFMPVKIKPLKASGTDPDIKELGTLAKPPQDYFENVVLVFLPHPL